MGVVTKQMGRYPLGVRVALVAVALVLLGMAMQAYSLIDWDGAVDLGLQNERFTGDAVERAWATESWGVAMADMLWLLPLSVVAFVGLLRRRPYGYAAALMALSCGTYFPLVFAFQRWATYPETALAALVVWTVPSLVAIAGLWTNRRWFAANQARFDG